MRKSLLSFPNVLLFCPECRSIYSTKRARCGLDDHLLEEGDRDPLIGETLDDRYLIVEPISKGGMGRIYRAKHAVLEHDYALKVLWGDYASAPPIVERFKREAKAVSKLRHPNIVEVTDFGRTKQGIVYLVMELVSGRTLESALKKESPFPPQRAARIARQIAAALGEAHKLGFVHRDVKPANVMLTSGKDDLKLLDFGLVAIIEPNEERLTKLGAVLGTPKYMAPEQCIDSRVTAAADLYSLGVILYEMLAGHAPFNGASVLEILSLHLDAPPPVAPPSEGLETLVAWLLLKNATKRPANAEVVIRELDRFVSGDKSRVPAVTMRSDTDEDMQGVHIHFEEPVEGSNEEVWDPDGTIAASAPHANASYPVLTPPSSMSSPSLVSNPSNPLLVEPELPREIATRRKKRRKDGEPSR